MTAEQLDAAYDPLQHWPPWQDMLLPKHLGPLVVYFLLFRLVSYLVKRNCWSDYQGFKRYRLSNLTICLLHSSISGLWAMLFFVFNPKLMMYDGVEHFYSTVSVQLPLMSIAYFTHDAIDMLSHEFSKWTIELLFHHFATTTALWTGVLPGRFLLCDYWALLMEFNSIFLHLRTIMTISGYSSTFKGFFNAVVYGNVISFIATRFITQLMFLPYSLSKIGHMHPWYSFVAVVGALVFGFINSLLFFRILASDGFLSDRWRKVAAVDRDDKDKKS